MRLIKNLQRLEDAAAAGREVLPTGNVGIVWTCHETRVDPVTLRPGEYIAEDVEVRDILAEVAAAGGRAGDVGAAGEDLDGLEPGPPPELWTVRERVTLDPQDLGDVYGLAGELVGRVVAIDGALITIDWAAPASAVARRG